MSPESKKSLVLALCLVASLSFSSFAQLAPFYPLKARSLDISVIFVGQVMSTMAVSQIISGFIVGRIMHSIGSSNSGKFKMMLGSLILIIIQNLMLASLAMVKNPQIFLFVSFVAQIFGGFGAGALSTSTMALLGTFANDEREKFIGWIEGANGLGLLFGPVLGAFLYNLGGYAMPFLMMASFLILSFPYISI